MATETITRTLACFCDCGEGGPFHPGRILDQVSECRMTLDHPMSSYGLPVLVGPSGRAYGPADLLRYEGDVQPGIACTVTCDADLAMVRAAHAAGYRIRYDLPDDPFGGGSRDPITGERN